jgi:phosphoenolpyruvate carboxykinase (ATP)
MYYYLSGYTSKAIGTELGLTETQSTFSSCFGSAFLTLYPVKYAEVLENKIIEHNPKIYLINTGWNGRKERLDLEKTRNIISLINLGKIQNKDFFKVPYFNLKIPNSLLKEDLDFYNPMRSFKKEDWYTSALNLAKKFNYNFKKFQLIKSDLIDKYGAFGPKI